MAFMLRRLIRRWVLRRSAAARGLGEPKRFGPGTIDLILRGGCRRRLLRLGGRDAHEQEEERGARNLRNDDSHCGLRGRVDDRARPPPRCGEAGVNTHGAWTRHEADSRIKDERAAFPVARRSAKSCRERRRSRPQIVRPVVEPPSESQFKFQPSRNFDRTNHMRDLARHDRRGAQSAGVTAPKGRLRRPTRIGNDVAASGHVERGGCGEPCAVMHTRGGAK